MNDVDAGHDLAVEGARISPRRDRSPSFPYIGLPSAIDRARQLYAQARRYEVRLADAAAAWQLGVKSSATLQTVAALLAFGLAEDSGSGEARKIKVSDRAWRILEDQRPGVREKELAEAARSPKLIADYIPTWGTGRPADNICISELKFERNFTDEAAARFLRVFDETIRFASPTPSDTIPDRNTDTGSPESEPLKEVVLPPTVKVGDYVQWTSGGVDQFRVPPKVVGIFPDGHHVQVFGSNTGIPMDELTVVPAPKAELAERTEVVAGTVAPAVESTSAGSLGDNDFSILQRGNRLQITADVDLDGIAILKEMLDDYESILRRLSGKKPN